MYSTAVWLCLAASQARQRAANHYCGPAVRPIATYVLLSRVVPRVVACDINNRYCSGRSPPRQFGGGIIKCTIYLNANPSYDFFHLSCYKYRVGGILAVCSTGGWICFGYIHLRAGGAVTLGLIFRGYWKSHSHYCIIIILNIVYSPSVAFVVLPVAGRAVCVGTSHP